MRFIGVDLASQPKSTSLCVVEWADRPRVAELFSGVDDELILATAAGADGVGMDCPFGWPDPFVDLVRRHHEGGSIADHPATLRQLRLRTTDLHIREIAGRDPLSVSTDLLGIVALRGIRILERLVGPGADRGGGAGVFEVYPAGSLAVWGLQSTGYKKKEATAARLAIVAALAEHIDLGGTEDRLVGSDDDLDAVITAVVTGLAVAGLTTAPSAENAEIAAVEGWIHVPTGSLRDVAGIRFDT